MLNLFIAMSSLNITLQKFKVLEDISIAMSQCEFLVEQRMKQLTNMIDEMIAEFIDFCDKCDCKLEINEISTALAKLIQVVEKVFNFIKGPFPTIESKIFLRIKKLIFFKKYNFFFSPKNRRPIEFKK